MVNPLWFYYKSTTGNDGILSYAYGHYATTCCAKQDADTGATVKLVDLGAMVNDAELGATLDDVDAWLYIPYDN